MDESSQAVVDVLTALCEARYALQSFAARVWAQGTYIYALTGRRSDQEWSLDPFHRRPSGYRLTETIGLPNDRDLTLVLNVGFGGDHFRVSGSIEIVWEVADGYDDEVLLSLPPATADNSSGLIDLLRSYVDQICRQTTMLDDLDLPRKTGS